MIEMNCIFEAEAEVGECPVWDGDRQVLYWVDCTGQKLNSLDPRSGVNRSWPMHADIGSCVLTEGSALIVGLRGGYHRFDPDSGEMVVLQAVEPARPQIRLNDGRCDRKGRYWAGTVHTPPSIDDPCGALYCLQPDLACERMLDGFLIPNGIAFSPDDRTFYMSDSHPAVQTIWAFDFDLESGRLSRRREFACTRSLGGRPDGAAVDCEGFYWIALIEGGQVARFAPDGTLDRLVQVPVSCPTMCAFGGPDLATMFITTARKVGTPPKVEKLAGVIFAFHPGVTGLPEPRFPRLPATDQLR